MDEAKTEMFEYLDDLRESGDVNMCDSRPLRAEFGLGKQEAREVLGEWQKSFTERHPNG